jgi:hypothetical protein
MERRRYHSSIAAHLPPHANAFCPICGNPVKPTSVALAEPIAHLTPTERDVWDILARHEGYVVSRERLPENAPIFICNLRKKLKARIVNIWGEGWSLNPRWASNADFAIDKRTKARRAAKVTSLLGDL